MISSGHTSIRRGRVTLWAPPTLLLITIFAVPVTNSKMKVLQLAFLAATVCAWLAVLRPKMRLVVIGGLSTVAALFFLLPARRDEASRQSLAAANTRALLHYEGTTYWWGR